MALGLKKGGVDWDSILEPRGSSTPRANVGIRKAGVDIAQRYYASTGGDTISYNLGIRKGGVDVGQMFRRLGYVPFVGEAPSVSVTNDGPKVSGSTFNFTCSATGTSPFSYQWYSPYGIISGATGSTYSTTISGPPDPYSNVYTCVVTNDYGSDESSTTAVVT